MMRSLVLILLPLLASSASPFVGSVTALTDSTFTTVIEQNPGTLWLLDFYAPWCGHCKKLAPVLDDVAARSNVPLAIGTIDATAHKSTASKFDVKGFPTLMSYRDGAFSKYKGGRSYDAIVSWATRMSGPAVSPLADLTDASVAAFVGSNIGFVFDAGANPPAGAVEGFEEFARAKQDSHSFSALEKPSSGATKVCRVEVGEAPKCLEGTSTSTKLDLDAFVAANQLKVLTEISSETFHPFSNAPNVKQVLAVLPQGVVTLLESQLKQMARDKSDKYVFGFVDYSRFGSWVDNFAEHKANNDAATFLVLDKPGSKYFVVDGIDKLDAELTKIEAGEVEGFEWASNNPKSGIMGAVDLFKRNMPMSLLIFVPFGLFVWFLFFMDAGEEEVAEIVKAKAAKDETKKDK